MYEDHKGKTVHRLTWESQGLDVGRVVWEDVTDAQAMRLAQGWADAQWARVESWSLSRVDVPADYPHTPVVYTWLGGSR